MFRVARNKADIIKAFIVRGIVFIEEQNTPYTIEIDAYEDQALHILGEVDNEPFAAGRIRFINDFAKLERLAIRRAWRGKGYGNDLMQFMLQSARQKGCTKFKLHAQTVARAFYEKHGFQAVGDVFFEANIEHVLMVRED